MTPTEPASPAQRCGLVAIVGRPNVGKSTLLNALVGQKISITSNKAQTTRHRITGMRTQGVAQFVFVDTPGFQMKHTAALNRTLNRTVLSSLGDVDVVLFVCEAGRFGQPDAKVLALLPPDKPALLVANKLDALARRQDVLPWLKTMQGRHAFAQYVPMSATREADVSRLLGIIEPYLPEQPWLYEEDALTDRSERFMASEMIREKLFRLTGDELPYSCTVVIDKFEDNVGPQAQAEPSPPPEGAAPPRGGAAAARRVDNPASQVVERVAPTGLVIGEGGERLNRNRSDARRLLKVIEAYLPEQPWFYDEDAVSDRSEKFLAGEMIREKLFRLTGDELPYTSTIVIDRFEEEPGHSGGRFVKIAATIIVERDGHKGIIIGDGGERLKRIGTEARTELERLFDAKVFLELWVKVRSGWADDETRLKSYGYE